MFQCAPVMKDCFFCNSSTQTPNVYKFYCNCCFHAICLNLSKIIKCPECSRKFTKSEQINNAHSASHYNIFAAYLQSTLVFYKGPHCHVIQTLVKRRDFFRKRNPVPFFLKNINDNQFIFKLVECIGEEIFIDYQKSKWTWEMIVAFVICMFEICNGDVTLMCPMTNSLIQYLIEKLDIADWKGFCIQSNFSSFRKYENLIMKDIIDIFQQNRIFKKCNDKLMWNWEQFDIESLGELTSDSE